MTGRTKTADLTRSPENLSSQVVTLTFFRFQGVLGRLWAFVMMGLARFPVARLPGLGFYKLMGAGTGEGFTPRPDTRTVVILTTWPDLDTAQRQVTSSDIFRRYRARADEAWTLHLSPVSSRGAWSGKAPFQPAGGPPPPGPIVALTRATIRPAILLKFWARVPDISRAIGSDPNVIFKLGVGEVPWFHQMTFSIWPDADTMARFARADGPHAKAISAVRRGDWFAEELYARFTILAAMGSWNGTDPLAGLDQAIAAE